MLIGWPKDSLECLSYKQCKDLKLLGNRVQKCIIATGMNPFLSQNSSMYLFAMHFFALYVFAMHLFAVRRVWQHTARAVVQFKEMIRKLNGVGPVDNRPSTIELHHLKREKKKCDI